VGYALVVSLPAETVTRRRAAGGQWVVSALERSVFAVETTTLSDECGFRRPLEALCWSWRPSRTDMRDFITRYFRCSAVHYTDH